MTGAPTFTQKRIVVTVTLDKDGAGNQYVLDGFATNVSIQKTGGVEFSQATVEILGLSLDKMAQLTTLAWRPLNRRWNAMEIQAGDSETGLSVVFQGEITTAYADLNGGKAALHIEAMSSSYQVLRPDPQLAITSAQPAEDALKMLAEKANLRFENDGVQATLQNVVLTGDPIAKMRQIADQVGADLIIDDGDAVLIPRGKPRTASGSMPLVSVDTGMIGYPTFSSQGINCACYFRPDLRMGSTVRVESIVPSATGTWKIVQLSHELSANNPGSNAWKTSFSGMWISE